MIIFPTQLPNFHKMRSQLSLRGHSVTLPTFQTFLWIIHWGSSQGSGCFAEEESHPGDNIQALQFKLSLPSPIEHMLENPSFTYH